MLRTVAFLNVFRCLQMLSENVCDTHEVPPKTPRSPGFQYFTQKCNPLKLYRPKGENYIRIFYTERAFVPANMSQSECECEGVGIQ